MFICVLLRITKPTHLFRAVHLSPQSIKQLTSLHPSAHRINLLAYTDNLPFPGCVCTSFPVQTNSCTTHWNEALCNRMFDWATGGIFRSGLRCSHTPSQMHAPSSNRRWRLSMLLIAEEAYAKALFPTALRVIPHSLFFCRPLYLKWRTGGRNEACSPSSRGFRTVPQRNVPLAL